MRGAGRIAKAIKKPEPDDEHKGVEPDRAAMELLEPLLSRRTGVTRLVDRRRERVSAVEHAQDAGEDHHGLHADHRSSELLITERPGHERRQSDRARDRTPEIVSGKKGTNELAARLLAEHTENDRRHREREEQDAADPGRQRDDIDRVKHAQQKPRRHRLTHVRISRGPWRSAPSSPFSSPDIR